MRSLIKKVIIIILLIAVNALASPIVQDIESSIIPKPQLLKKSEGIFVISADTRLIADDLFSTLVLQFNKFLKAELGFGLDESKAQDPDLAGRTIEFIKYASNKEVLNKTLKTWDLQFTEKMQHEGYILIIQDRNIILTAQSERGVFYGLQTLSSLIRHYGTNLPALAIQDWPDMKMRGITDDFSRGQVSTMKNFKKLIRFLAEYKMNTYMPYMEDVFKFKTYPAIGQKRGALSAQEWTELQAYADSYYVEIIPIFQTLGHYENLLLQPEFMHLAEFPGAASLNINSEKTYEFLEKVLDEIIPVFKSQYFHIGADESWDVGAFATRSDADRNSVGSLHAHHYRRVFEMIKKHNKKIMMYGDIILRHPEILNEIPKDIIMFDWHYYPNNHYKSAETFAKAGQPFIVSAGVHNWRVLFPDFTDALANIYHLTHDGYKNNAMGSITSNWGDYGGMNLRELIYYPYAYSAAVSWNIFNTDYTDFDLAFYTNFYGQDDPGYAHVYHTLNTLSNHVEWLTLVSHPFCPLADNKINILRQASEMPRMAFQLKRQLYRLKPVRNAQHLDYLSWCADMYGWYGRLSALKIEMYDLGYDRDYKPERSNPKTLKSLSDKARELAADIHKLNIKFSELWQRDNRSDNMNRMTLLWDRVEKYLTIKATEIEQGNLTFNGQLTTPFITYPLPEGQESLSKVYLRKSLNLDKIPQNAVIQIIANSHGKIWINGKKVGEIYARKSLSALVESERVKYWDVSRFLKKGKNTIAVEVRNYRSGIASANIWLQTEMQSGWQSPLVSEIYWKASDKEFDNWTETEYDDAYWPNATDVKKDWLISKPYFEYNLPSRIEFFSGYGK